MHATRRQALVGTGITLAATAVAGAPPTVMGPPRVTRRTLQGRHPAAVR